VARHERARVVVARRRRDDVRAVGSCHASRLLLGMYAAERVECAAILVEMSLDIAESRARARNRLCHRTWLRVNREAVVKVHTTTTVRCHAITGLCKPIDHRHGRGVCARMLDAERRERQSHKTFGVLLLR
jgi:hypothetical protein